MAPIDTKEVERQARPAPQQGEYEIIIVGAGPAGLTAAVYAARKRIPTLLVSGDIGGQVLLTAQVENYMGYQSISGVELIQKFSEQVERYPIDQRLGDTVATINRDGEMFEVHTNGGGRYRARALIIATGKRSRTLDVPGEAELIGRGVSYCSICDGAFFADQDVAVVGGGNSALEAVLDLTRLARKVYLIHRSQFSADAIIQEKSLTAERLEIWQGYVVQKIIGDKEVKALRVAPRDGGNPQEINLQGVFIEIGLLPNTDFVRDFLPLNESGEILIDRLCRTEVPGVFAAGDVTNVPDKQIVIAAGEGAKAALSAFQYISGIEDRRKYTSY